MIAGRSIVAVVGVATLVGPLARVHAAPHREGRGGDLGLGATLGDPTGVSLKWYPHPQHTLQASLGFGTFHLGGGRFDVSYLWHGRPWSRTDELVFTGYVGLGVGFAFWHARYIGPGGPDRFRKASFFFRAPVLGLAFNFMRLPLDVFVETAYSPLVGPPVSYWNFDLALGARYWF